MKQTMPFKKSSPHLRDKKNQPTNLNEFLLQILHFIPTLNNIYIIEKLIKTKRK